MATVASDCIKVDPKSTKLTCPGDPVKLAGRQGHYRFVKLVPIDAAELVGPYFPDASRTQEITRVQLLVNLRPAAKTATKKSVQMTAASSAVSDNAKRKRK